MRLWKALMKEGEQKGRVEGRVAGRVEGLEEAAARMLQKGVDLATVMEMTLLPKQRVETLFQQIKRRMKTPRD